MFQASNTWMQPFAGDASILLLMTACVLLSYDPGPVMLIVLPTFYVCFAKACFLLCERIGTHGLSSSPA